VIKYFPPLQNVVGSSNRVDPIGLKSGDANGIQGAPETNGVFCDTKEKIMHVVITIALSFSSFSRSAAALRSCSDITVAEFFIRCRSAALITNVLPDGSSLGTLL